MSKHHSWLFGHLNRWQAICLLAPYSINHVFHRTSVKFHDNPVPRVLVPYCASLTKRRTLGSSVTSSILIGFRNNGNERKQNTSASNEPRVCQLGMRNSTGKTNIFGLPMGTLVSQPLVKGNEDSGYKVDLGSTAHAHLQRCFIIISRQSRD